MSERRLRGVIAGFAAIGAALAGYLVFKRYTGGVISCTTGGCETVQHSSYSSLAGIPVAVLGLCAYVAIFALSFVLTETARAAQLAIAVAGVAFSGYLLWAQAIPIGAFCDWCLASDAIMTVIALLVLLRVRAAQGFSAAHPRSIPTKGDTMNARPLCALHMSVGESEECPGSGCAFWEEGGAAIDPGCVLERARFELESRPDVARWLLQLRYDLENARSAEEMRRIRGSLNQVLPPGLHE